MCWARHEVDLYSTTLAVVFHLDKIRCHLRHLGKLFSILGWIVNQNVTSSFLFFCIQWKGNQELLFPLQTLYVSLSLSAKCPLLLTNREAQVTFLTIFGPILDSIHRMLIGAVDLACVVGMNVWAYSKNVMQIVQWRSLPCVTRQTTPLWWTTCQNNWVTPSPLWTP